VERRRFYRTAGWLGTMAYACLIACLFALLAAAPALAEKRVALVIGNSAYKHAPALANPKNDAEGVATALKRLDFEVLLGVDLEKGPMERLLRGFADKIEKADVALVFYAGHGLQVSGSNYLVPIDARLDKEQDLAFEAISLDLIQRLMEQGQRINIMMLDACRDNPLARNLARSMGTRSTAIGRGLGQTQAGIGTLIVYATQPGNVALDGEGRNSPFTEALLAHLETRGLEIRQVLTRVRQGVIRATKGKQVPWDSSSLTGDFFFAAAPAGPTPAPTPAHGSVFRDCPDCPEMVVIPAGTFTMGSPASEMDRRTDEGPQRQVRVKSFALGKHEVTRGEWSAFVRESGHKPLGGCFVWNEAKQSGEKSDTADWRSIGFAQTDRHPVVCVSWDDAKAYSAWLSRKSGKTYRLASEAEWEYAARAGTQTARPWGDDSEAGCHHANGADASFKKKIPKRPATQCDDGHPYTAPVGGFEANRFGLHDLIGNAWEWVEDCWNGSYDGAGSDGWAWLSGDCTRRVMRGGSWSNHPRYLRSAGRATYVTTYRDDDVGFRLARTLD